MSVFVITSIRPFSQLKSFISIFLPAFGRPHLKKSERLGAAAGAALRELAAERGGKS